MSRNFARLAAVFVVVGMTGPRPIFADPRAPAAPSGLFLDWLSGWRSAQAATQEDLYRIGLDPETGEWGRAPVQTALEVSGVMAPPLIVHRADGSIEIIVDPRNVEYVVARLGPGGRPTVDCVPREALAPVLSTPAASGPPDR